MKYKITINFGKQLLVEKNTLEYLIESRDSVLKQLNEMFPNIQFNSSLRDEVINLTYKKTPVIEFECDEYNELTRFVGNKRHLYMNVDLYYSIENISSNQGE